MDSVTPIGGFFELQLPERQFPHADAILLSTGRACMEYVLRAKAPRHVHVPLYTCDVVLAPMRTLGIPYSFYHVNEVLEIDAAPDVSADEMLMANNYFGVKDAYCRNLAAQYGDRLLIDCSQAWFARPTEGSHCFYTPRKFFGLPDGGCLHTAERLEATLAVDTSYQRMSHLIQRLDIGPEGAYPEFQRNDASLSGQDMRAMSLLTRRLLASVDHEAARRQRLANFALLDAALGASNRFNWSRVEAAGPMVYPYWGGRASLRQELIAAKVYVATYWPNVFNWCCPTDVEHRLASDMITLPIDQRYGENDMARILDIIG